MSWSCLPLEWQKLFTIKKAINAVSQPSKIDIMNFERNNTFVQRVWVLVSHGWIIILHETEASVDLDLSVLYKLDLPL